jgi:hypothetical protein
MLKSLFNFPYYKTKISPENYDKEQLVSSMLFNYSIQPSRNEWNPHCDMHHSYNDAKNSKFEPIDYSSVIPLYTSEIQKFIDEFKYVQEINWSFAVQNYTVTSKEQNMLSHHHIPSVFAAVHYLKFDKNEHTSTVFHNPSQYGQILELHYSEQKEVFDHCDENILWLWNDVLIDVEEDDFIIFPAILNHSIGPSNSDKKRITISLNIEIEKKTEDSRETVH